MTEFEFFMLNWNTVIQGIDPDTYKQLRKESETPLEFLKECLKRGLAEENDIKLAIDAYKAWQPTTHKRIAQ